MWKDIKVGFYFLIFRLDLYVLIIFYIVIYCVLKKKKVIYYIFVWKNIFVNYYMLIYSCKRNVNCFSVVRFELYFV